MLSKQITQTATKIARKGVFKLKKYAPEILTGIAVVGGVASTVFACKATIKSQPIIEKAKNDLDKIHEKDNDPLTSYDEYSKKQVKKDVTRVYFETGKALAKNYAPSVTLGLFSISCMVGSNVVARKRFNAMLAAYTALGNSFREYRNRLEQQISESDSSEEKLPNKLIEIEDRPIYQFIFDKNNPNWKDDVEYNLAFLKGAQRYVDFTLKRDEFLFVNDVLGELAIQKIPSGQLDGWIYDMKNPDSYHDGYVSFGLYNRDGSKTDMLKAYENGDIDYLVITLNVDGTIYDRI